MSMKSDAIIWMEQRIGNFPSQNATLPVILNLRGL